MGSHPPGADYFALGKSLERTGDLDQAARYFSKAVKISEQFAQADPGNATRREYVGEVYNGLRSVLAKQGDHLQSMLYARKSYQLFQQLTAADPTNALARTNFALSSVDMGQLMISNGEPQQGLPYVRKAITIFEGIDHKNRYEIAGQASSYGIIGTFYFSLAAKDHSNRDKLVHLQEARSWYQKSFNTWQQEPDHGAVDPLDGDLTSDLAARQLAKCETSLKELGAAKAELPH